ncbi:MAG: prolyl aminopeptidase [Halobacteriovoraceae bacterium]|jgi:proline iminopeptidase|nr:prolyl aminopeptidase [Halobacteriovoraceae bacterium]MBT5094543.1 prolyl aminopeptidase [Halobacteriovoraceae bacterium]
MAKLYPEIEPYNSGHLAVNELHSLYYEEVGNPEGTPVVFLHGGPGGGCGANYRRYFNPEKYRIILFDQRGCGRSTPFSELKDNTTWHSVADIEKLRNHFSLERWAVFGGSWGSTLALAYSISHPDSVTGLFLRGIFLVRKKEIDWFYQEGCSKIYPDAWDKYLAPIPPEERGDLVSAYHKRLTSEDPQVRAEAAKAWAVWEASTSKLIQDQELMKSFEEDQFADAFARIECHYFTQSCFFETDNWLIENIEKIRHIPTVIVHGRYDVVCPIESAWELKKAFPEARLHIAQGSGHSLSESEIAGLLIAETDAF